MAVITFYNLSVKFETRDLVLQNHVTAFLNKYYTVKEKGFGQQANGPEKEKGFFSKLANRGVWQLHNNQFVHLYHYLKEINYKLEITEKIDERNYPIVEANMVVRDGWVLRDKQLPVAEFLLTEPTKSKLVPLATGSGKTFVSLHSIAQLKQRLAIVVVPKYMDKWASDVATIHEAKIQDVLQVSGAKQIRALVQMAKEGKVDYNYFLFSNRTLSNFIEDYEKEPELTVDMYGCSPIELFPLLGIGTMLMDEVHEQFYSIFKILIYSNVKFHIGLSATLLSEEPVVKRVHKVMFPADCVYGDSMIKKYTDVYAVAYGMQEHRKKVVKTTNYGSNNYSHIAFEQSITKRTDLLEIYYRLIDTTINEYYLPDYQPKDKLLIFVATIHFATQLTAYLKKKFPDKLVNRYCDDDPYENLMTGEIIISTVLSSGTAVDIPHLRVVIQTVCISSPVSNIQSLGRLRELKDRDVKFVYLYCENIGKHKDYHMKRVELFKDRVATISYRRSRVSFLSQPCLSQLLNVAHASNDDDWVITRIVA